MRGGATFLVGAVLLANSACGNDGKLEVRAMPTPLAAGRQPVPFRIAEAYGQLALGNVALALESFRKAAREDPSSVQALAGIATCYDRMGRFDLSRRNYEAALALAPGNASLLGAFAASLDQQGQTAEAASVRREIAARLAAAAPTAPAAIAPQVAVAAVRQDTPVGRSVTVALPPPQPAVVHSAPAPAPEKVAPEQPRPAPIIAAKPILKAEPKIAALERPKLAAVVAAEPVPTPKPKIAAPEQPKPAPIIASKSVPTAEPKIAAPVAPALPLAQAPAKGVGSVTITLPPPRPAEAKPILKAPAVAVVRTGPRIERLSRGEVALITTPAPQWKATTAIRLSPRFVPLRQAAGVLAEVRLLNAARVDRLAARTRNYLGNRGWRKVMIGDAEIARAKSLIVYPTGQRELAAKLSAQTGIAMTERPGVRMVTMLLGRDAAGLPLRARG